MTNKTTYERMLDTMGSSELLTAEVSRRDALKKSAGFGAAALAVAGVGMPLALSLTSETAIAQSTPGSAFQLIQRYEAFYRAYLNQIPSTAYTAAADAFLTIQTQTDKHLAYLVTAAGTATPTPAYNWTGGGTAAGPFATMTNANYLTLLQYLSDYRVRVYLGGLGSIVGDAKFSEAVGLNMNASRHAAAVRRILLGSTAAFNAGTNGVPAGTAEPGSLGTGTAAAGLTALLWYVYGPPLASSTAIVSEGEDNKTTINNALASNSEGFDMPHSATRVNKVLSFFNA